MSHVQKMDESIGDGGGSVQFSRSVVSDSLRPHESQHARPPCPSPTPSVFNPGTVRNVVWKATNYGENCLEF